MSLIILANAIDQLVDARKAYVTESETTVTISALSAENATRLRAFCEVLVWRAGLFDSADDPCPPEEAPESDFAPFRLVITKPPAPNDTVRLLTNHGFSQLLGQGHPTSHWQIARLTGSVITQARVLQPWHHARIQLSSIKTKSPRALVREFGDERRVPFDVRPWLAEAIDEDLFATPAVQVWVHLAANALMRSIPDEIETPCNALKFRGPPHLTLPSSDGLETPWDYTTFNALQAALAWVFENERETEMRHILLNAELARSGPTNESSRSFLCIHLADALESAKIAYQMALSDTSRDTLNALNALRSTVTDDINRLAEVSRHLAVSIAAAIAAGIGLIAARTVAGAPAGVIGAVMAVVVLYVVIVLLSACQFVRLQRCLRSKWQPKLYRFLPAKEYTQLVTTPTKQAENSLLLTVSLASMILIVLAVESGWLLWSAFVV